MEEKKDTTTRSRAIIVNVLLLVLGLGVAYGLYAGLQFGYSTEAPLRVVVSGSMVPKYNINDVVVVKGVGSQIIPLLYVFNVNVEGVNSSSLKVGDDIIFLCVPLRCPYGVSDPIVHEIFQIVPNSQVCGGGIQFVTHGIANLRANPSDQGERPCESDVIGVVTGTVPYIGYVSEFLKSTLGIVLIIVLIGILLAIEILEPEKDETKSGV